MRTKITFKITSDFVRKTVLKSIFYKSGKTTNSDSSTDFYLNSIVNCHTLSYIFKSLKNVTDKKKYKHIYTSPLYP